MKNSFWSLLLRQQVSMWEGVKMEVANFILTDKGFWNYTERLGYVRHEA